ncbi:MAG: hypothetical protein WD894_05005 [Pirellulales bacterium]
MSRQRATQLGDIVTFRVDPDAEPSGSVLGALADLLIQLETDAQARLMDEPRSAINAGSAPCEGQ